MNILKYAIIVLILSSGTIFTYLVLNNKLNLNIEYVRTIEVTAHGVHQLIIPKIR